MGTRTHAEYGVVPGSRLAAALNTDWRQGRRLTTRRERRLLLGVMSSRNKRREGRMRRRLELMLDRRGAEI